MFTLGGSGIPDGQRQQLSREANDILRGNLITFFGFGIGLEILAYGLKHVAKLDYILT